MLSEPLLGSGWTEIDIAALKEAERVLLCQEGFAVKPRVIALLARLANHFKNDRSAEEWRMLFDDYFEDLKEFSDGDIEEAITKHRRDKKWFPKIAELREHCHASQTIRHENLKRLDHFFDKIGREK